MDVAEGWLSEGEVKESVSGWLTRQGWQVAVAWGRTTGPDIIASRDEARWVIEAKGGGSLQPMRVNYFLAILGEILQCMDDPSARYSIALPAMGQFERLWMRLPGAAKARLGVTALFVSPNGRVGESTDIEGGAVATCAAATATDQGKAEVHVSATRRSR